MAECGRTVLDRDAGVQSKDTALCFDSGKVGRGGPGRVGRLGVSVERLRKKG